MCYQSTASLPAALGSLLFLWESKADLEVRAAASLQIDALVEVVEAVRGRAEVYLDGGIRKGSDVLKALALGAKCVFIGRPALWGLAYKVRSSGFACLLLIPSNTPLLFFKSQRTVFTSEESYAFFFGFVLLNLKWKHPRFTQTQTFSVI